MWELRHLEVIEVQEQHPARPGIRHTKRPSVISTRAAAPLVGEAVSTDEVGLPFRFLAVSAAVPSHSSFPSEQKKHTRPTSMSRSLTSSNRLCRTQLWTPSE